MIYVLGSINMDLVSKASHMPKDGETLKADEFYANMGGKGANQAVAIARLGGKVKMIGKVGNDEYGESMKANLLANGVDVEFVSVAPTNSGIANIVVAGGENRIVCHGGANDQINNQDVDNGLSGAKCGDILVVQLEIPIDVVIYACDKAKQKGMMVILNPAPAQELGQDLLCNVDIISPNETETEVITGVAPDSEVEMALAVKNLYRYGVRHVVITMGERGSIVTYGNNIAPIMPRKVEVVDSTGAGDTYVGAIATKLDDGVDIVSACYYASIAASITVTRDGAIKSIPTKAEVDEVIIKEGL